MSFSHGAHEGCYVFFSLDTFEMMTRFDDRRLASSCVLYTIPIDIGHPATARMLIRILFANLHTVDKQLFLAAIRNARSSPLGPTCPHEDL